MKIKKALIFIFLCAIALFTVSCDNNTVNTNTAENNSSATSDYKDIRVEIKLQGYGSIIVLLDYENAPITVEHFIKLAESKAYDNSYITRIEPGFVVQGGQGCTNNDTIKGEFSANGVDNKIVHNKGVISMARAQSYDSASNQFFIVLDDAAKSSLDGLYAGFGYVIDGMDIIDEIANSLTLDMLTQNYYGYSMGFLNEESYIIIESIRVIEQ